MKASLEWGTGMKAAPCQNTHRDHVFRINAHLTIKETLELVSHYWTCWGLSPWIWIIYLNSLPFFPILTVFLACFLFSEFLKAIFIGQMAFHIVLSIFNKCQFSRTSRVQKSFWMRWGCLLEPGFLLVFLKFTITTTTEAFSLPFSFFHLNANGTHLSRKFLFHIQ